MDVAHIGTHTHTHTHTHTLYIIYTKYGTDGKLWGFVGSRERSRQARTCLQVQENADNSKDQDVRDTQEEQREAGAPRARAKVEHIRRQEVKLAEAARHSEHNPLVREKIKIQRSFAVRVAGLERKQCSSCWYAANSTKPLHCRHAAN